MNSYESPMSGGDAGQFARILDTEPANDPNALTFLICEGTTSRDVVATLRYHNPSEEEVTGLLGHMIGHALCLGIIAPQVVPLKGEEIADSGVFRSNPISIGFGRRIEDIWDDLASYYGKQRIPEKLRELSEALIDRGAFKDVRITVYAKNEFTNILEGGPDADTRIGEEIKSWEMP